MPALHTCMQWATPLSWIRDLDQRGAGTCHSGSGRVTSPGSDIVGWVGPVGRAGSSGTVNGLNTCIRRVWRWAGLKNYGCKCQCFVLRTGNLSRKCTLFLSWRLTIYSMGRPPWRTTYFKTNTWELTASMWVKHLRDWWIVYIIW